MNRLKSTNWSADWPASRFGSAGQPMRAGYLVVGTEKSHAPQRLRLAAPQVVESFRNNIQLESRPSALRGALGLMQGIVADRVCEPKGDDAVRWVENQPWDPSVASLVAFPEALITLNQNAEVRNVGDAFPAQDGRSDRSTDRRYASQR